MFWYLEVLSTRMERSYKASASSALYILVYQFEIFLTTYKGATMLTLIESSMFYVYILSSIVTGLIVLIVSAPIFLFLRC
jgi:hypothetical protein